MGGPECREIMAPHQMLRRRLHRIGIERLDDAPHQPRIEGQRRAAIGDAIDIGPPGAGKAGVPVVRHRFARQDGDRGGPHSRIDCLHQAKGGDVFGDIGMGAHGEAMHPGIRSPGSMDYRRLACNGRDRILDRLLDAGAMRLPLPAHEGPAVKFDGEGEAGHDASRVRFERSRETAWDAFSASRRGGGERGGSYPSTRLPAGMS